MADHTKDGKGPVTDPNQTDEDKLAKFREVRDQIDRRIREWLVEQTQ